VFDDTARSLVSGTREALTIEATYICCALLAVKPGELTFPINPRLLSGGLVVTDGQVKEAMRFAFEKLKLNLCFVGHLPKSSLAFGTPITCTSQSRRTPGALTQCATDSSRYVGIILVDLEDEGDEAI
jgi:threonine dehydratase